MIHPLGPHVKRRHLRCLAQNESVLAVRHLITTPWVADSHA